MTAQMWKRGIKALKQDQWATLNYSAASRCSKPQLHSITSSADACSVSGTVSLERHVITVGQ